MSATSDNSLVEILNQVEVNHSKTSVASTSDSPDNSQNMDDQYSQINDDKND